MPTSCGNGTGCSRDRISSLSAAVLRVSASLDLETVLREIVDSARALTGARYGLITTVDDAGQPQDFVTAGLASGVHAVMAAWGRTDRGSSRTSGTCRNPLRVADLPAYVRDLGFSTELIVSKTMQCTPMRHRDVHVGNFFLGEKEGGPEFTSADEEVLVLFASQAATAIANARTHRDERRARADLEALVETCPVGVVVFDGGSGRLVSFNREARRIVEPLRTPGGELEELLDVITCRRGDGREVPLAQFPMAQQMSSAETVRAEEITLSVPDGRRVTTLVNATPIRSADGAVESMVVTPAGPGAAGGAGASAGRVPVHGEPRAAHAAELHQGLGNRRARRFARLRTWPRRGSSSASSTSRPTRCAA